MENNENLCLYCGRFGKNLQTRLPKRFWIKMTALLLSSYLVTLTMQAPVFAFTQRLTISNPDPKSVTEAFPQVAEYKPHFLCRYRDFEKVSGQDASLLYIYMSRNASDPTVYVLVGVSSSITNLHSWEVCLVTWQIAQGRPQLVDVLDSREVQIMQDPPITGQYLVFEHPSNYTQVTLYWYLKALFKTGLTIEPKYTRISLIVLTKNPDGYPELEQKLLSMGRYIAAYWEPIKGKSLVSIGIPTMQVLFGIAILSAIILQVTQYTNEWRKKTTNLKIFEALAPAKEKILYQTIKELNEKTKETTAKNIASALEESEGKASRINELVDMLKNLEQHGIIRADIVNKQDDPRLVWKP